MASLTTIARVVAREGAKWGLYPVIKDGKVKVCEKVAELPLRDGPKIVEYSFRTVASLDESSGFEAFSAILMHRMSRFRHNIAAEFLKNDAAKKAEAQKLINDRREQFKAFLRRSNRRIVSIGPAGM